MIKHKHKYSFIYMCVTLLACLCLVFGVSYTLARYSTSDSGTGTADIDPFIVDAKLYDESGTEVTDLSTTTDKLEEYTATYYLVVYNYCDFNVFYEVSINEPFIFSADTITSGNVPVDDPYGYVVIPLYISVDPDADLDNYKENNSIPINIGVDVTQGEIEEEVLDPHALTNRTIMTCDWTLDYYYLAENITTSSAVTFASELDNVDLYLNGYTLSSTYNDYIITISSGSLTLADGGTVEGYDGNELTLSGSGTITNTYGGGINILSGAAFAMSNQSIVSCLTHGVNVNSNATFTICEAPVIDNTNTVGVYLCSGAEITLGDGLASGADIAIDLETKQDYARVTTIEMNDTYYAYDALKYINIDDVNYETTVNWDSYDNWATGGGVCIQIINFIPINLSVAVQNSGEARDDISFYTDAGNDVRGWEGEETGYAFTMLTNEEKDANNELSQYDYYYDFGTINRREDYGFCISVNEEHDKIQEWGLAPGDDIWVIDDETGEGNIGYEFNFWGSRFDGQYWQKLSEWGFNFGSLSDTDKEIIHQDCELLVVLVCDFNDIDPTGDFTDWDKHEGSFNNVVNDYYFIVDGTTRYNRGDH